MKRIPLASNLVLFAIFASVFFAACNKRSGDPRVLVFTKTAGYFHESIPSGVAAIQKLGAQNGFMVDTTSNAEMFVEDSLKKYAAVVFMSTTGDVLNNYQEAEFERYIQAGGGFVGIHAAADAEYDWGWYGRMVGGYFATHPGIQDSFPNVQPGVFQVVNKDHISTKGLPEQWKRTDEFYSFKKMDSTVNVLLKIDENSFKGGYMNGNHPMAWYHDYDGGRAWYTNLGHTNETFSEELFLKHLLGGIQYAIGDNRELDFDKARTAKVPEEDRFTKVPLASAQFFEPTEMTVLPNLDILVAQRRGEILLYKKGDSVMRQAGFLNVYYKTSTPGVNAEEGVLGIQADPNFSKNNYVFIYYSPADVSVNRLSRFKYVNDKLDSASEKVVLEVKSDREICCHTGGSIAFDKDGLLYVSTGDNSTPFNDPKAAYVNHGFAPLNDEPGKTQYDALRSSGNANDLRGKILRIRVKEDGTYDVPDGNLYPKGAAGTRPEIYVQGNRNPYRISVDQKTGYLYWGEVGPDAAADSLGTRGPRGYDEVNQARKAGNFGWPMFVGNNYPYRRYSYANGQSGPAFDPARPLNESRNNTGIKNLPPAQPAFIWYPYAASTDFPQVQTGGRNAMAGPVYYTEMFPKESRLPDYYNGKLFIYDWIRGWIKAVTMQENGDFDKMEPFMGNTKFNALIDMEVGPDGKLYILEYGSGWFSKNPDAALSRIDYNGGNLAPKVAGVHVDKSSGTLPLKVVATVDARDPEKKDLKYTWNLGNGVTKETSGPRLEHTFDKAGEYTVTVTVSDKEGAKTQSPEMIIVAGNEMPVVDIQLQGNKSFYFPGKPVSYTVRYQDRDDPAAAANTAGLLVSADYIEGLDKAGANMGHQVMTEAMMGKNLVQSLDCKACHKVDEKSIGPAYAAVAEKYKNNAGAVNHLVNKVIKGGAGVWGEQAMPAHPNLKESDVRQMVAYVLSLSGAKQQTSLPAQGTVQPTLGKPAKENGVLVLTASYTDKGANGIRPLTGSISHALRNSQVSFSDITSMEGFSTFEIGGRTLMVMPKAAGWFRLDSIDLTGINSAELAFGWQKAPQFGYVVELRLDKPDGQQIGGASLKGGLPTKGPGISATIRTNIAPVNDGKYHNLYIVTRPVNPTEPNQAAISSLRFGAK